MASCNVRCFLCLRRCGSLFHLRGMQVRRFGDMLKCLTEKGDNKQDTGLSSFQAFATTVGGRVGTGNIAGTATCNFYGGTWVQFSGCG